MSTLDPIDFLMKPDVCYGMSDDTLRRSDLAMLRRIAGCDYGHHGNREDAPNSVLRLQSGGLVSHDGRVWTVTALGHASIRMSASCRDGSEGLRRPDAYYRGRREDADHQDLQPSDVNAVVCGIQELERSLAVSIGPVGGLQGVLAAYELNKLPGLQVTADIMPDGRRSLVIAVRPMRGRLERVWGGVVSAWRWLRDYAEMALALVLAAVAWTAMHVTGEA